MCDVYLWADSFSIFTNIIHKNLLGIDFETTKDIFGLGNIKSIITETYAIENFSQQ